MLIQCTKKVLDRLHLESNTSVLKQNVTDDFFCWHANIITADRKKVLVFVNNSTRLAVICYRPKPSVYKKPGEYLTAGIRNLFSTLGMRPEIIEQYLQKAGEAQITSSGTRSQIVITDYQDPEAQAYFEPEDQKLYSDRQLMLCDVFENRNSCVYSYDFGDDWEHVITVERRKEKGGNTRFVLLEKEGERPPEDVGGEGGFEEFMRIINDPEDPEYERMKLWAEGTCAKPETIEEINKKLRWL